MIIIVQNNLIDLSRVEIITPIMTEWTAYPICLYFNIITKSGTHIRIHEQIKTQNYRSEEQLKASEEYLTAETKITHTRNDLAMRWNNIIHSGTNFIEIE